VAATEARTEILWPTVKLTDTGENSLRETVVTIDQVTEVIKRHRNSGTPVEGTSADELQSRSPAIGRYIVGDGSATVSPRWSLGNAPRILRIVCDY
jgi:hypothetical protein